MIEEQKIIDEYLNRIKVQLVNLKFSFSPSKLKGKKMGVPMEFLAGIDSEAQDRLKTQFKVLARGFHVDEELAALGLAGTFAAYCEHEESVKSDFLYTVDGIGSVILSEDEQRFRARVAALEKEAEVLATRLAVMLKDKIYGLAHQLYAALKDIWSGREPEWWILYRRENPIDSRGREDVFCDLMFRKCETTLSLKNPDFRILLTRFNPETMAEPQVRKAFARAFCHYVGGRTWRTLDDLIGRDPNDRQATLF